MDIRNFCAGMTLALAALCYGGSANAAEFCSDAYYINQTLGNGARWDMCWTHDSQHGIRYHHVH